MRIARFTTVVWVAALLMTGLGAATAGASASAAATHVSASRGGTKSHPVIYTANIDGSSSSPYLHGRLYVARGGPDAWLSHPHFPRWNASQARATGALWGADAGTFSLGRHVTLVFSHPGERMGYYFFTHLDIIGSHGIGRHWHMSLPSPRGNTWVPNAS